MSHLVISHVINSNMSFHTYLVKIIVEIICVKINFQIISRGLAQCYIAFSFHNFKINVILYSNYLYLYLLIRSTLLFKSKCISVFF